MGGDGEIASDLLIDAATAFFSTFLNLAVRRDLTGILGDARGDIRRTEEEEEESEAEADPEEGSGDAEIGL